MVSPTRYDLEFLPAKSYDPSPVAIPGMANSFFHEFKRQTSRFLRSNIKTARLLLTDVTLAELLAEEATRTKPWPPRDTRTLRVISRAAFEVDDFWRVADVLHKRFKRFDRKRWRKAYKAMILLEHLLTHGPLSFADELQSDKEVIQRMCNFQYVDERGYNWGLTVKKKAERVLKLLEKGPFLEEERDRLRKATRGIEGFDSFNVSWPLTITVEEATQNHGISLQRQQDDARTEEKPSKEDSDENGGCSVGMKVHPAEELIPLLSCEEGRKIEVLSHQLS